MIPYWASSCSSRWLYASHGQITVMSEKERTNSELEKEKVVWFVCSFSWCDGLNVCLPLPSHSIPGISSPKLREAENHKLYFSFLKGKLSRWHSWQFTQERPTQWRPSWEACSWTGGCSSVWTWGGRIQGRVLWGELCCQSSLQVWPHPNSYFCCLNCNGTVNVSKKVMQCR